MIRVDRSTREGDICVLGSDEAARDRERIELTLVDPVGDRHGVGARSIRDRDDRKEARVGEPVNRNPRGR